MTDRKLLKTTRGTFKKDQQGNWIPITDLEVTLPEVEIKPKKNNNLNWFTRATLGAAMADNPSVMTASGWKQDDNGNYVLKPDEGSKLLSNNLAVLSLTSPTGPLASGAKGVMWGLKNPWIQTGLTIDGARNLFTDNGVLKTYRHFRDGEYGKGALSLTGDVLDAAGAYGLGNRVYHIGLQVFIPTNRAAHAYVTIAPSSYESPFKRAYPWIKSMLTGKYPDIEHPSWKGTINEVSEYIPSDVKNSTKIATTARDDAWRIYNRLPQKYGTYIKNPDGSYFYDLDRISKLSEGTFKPILKPLGPHSNGYDYITGAGGGLTKHINHVLASEPDRGIDYGVLEIEDLWDLQPFSRPGDRIYKKVNDSFGNFIRTNADKIYTKLFYPLYNSSFGYNYLGGRFLNKLRYEFDPHIIKPNGKIDTWFKNFEVGKISGGKPFLMHTEIPYTNKTKIQDTNIGGVKMPIGVSTTSLGFNDTQILHPEIMEYNMYGLKGINKFLNNKILNNKLEPLELEDFSKYIIKNNKQ